MKSCPKCNNLHNKAGKFCSRSCANSRERTHEFKEKVSLKLKGKAPSNKGSSSKEDRSCPVCRKRFTVKYRSSKKVFCSLKCNPNVGGAREGSGRSKSGYYKGIYCGSTYELAWVIYQIDHNKEFSRFPSFVEKDGRKYYPDFIQDGVIIEIKGGEPQDSVDFKTNIAKHCGYEVIVLRREDLKNEFEWVKRKYKTTKLFDLYDEYTPQFNLKCSHCSVEFSRDTLRKTNKAFCSPKCSMSGNRMNRN